MSPDPSYSENSERKSLSSFPYWLQGTHSQSLFSEISALLNLRRAHTAGYYKTVNQWTYKPVQRRSRTCCDHWWSAACSASLAERCNLGDRWAIDASWSDSGELFATSLAFTAKNSVKVVGQKCRSKLPLTWRASKPITGLRLDPGMGLGEYRFYARSFILFPPPRIRRKQGKFYATCITNDRY